MAVIALAKGAEKRTATSNCGCDKESWEKACNGKRWFLLTLRGALLITPIILPNACGKVPFRENDHFFMRVPTFWEYYRTARCLLYHVFSIFWFNAVKFSYTLTLKDCGVRK